jgi:hypothetical protein
MLLRNRLVLELRKDARFASEEGDVHIAAHSCDVWGAKEKGRGHYANAVVSQRGVNGGGDIAPMHNGSLWRI